MKVHHLIPVLLFFALSSCGNEKNNPVEEPQVVEQDPAVVNGLVADFLRTHLSKADTGKAMHIDKDTLVSMPYLKTFYASHNYSPAWSDKGALNAAGDSLYAVLKDAESYGLIPSDYHLDALDSMLGSVYDSTKKSYNINKLSCADLMLTDAFFTFSVHVSVGRMMNDSAATRSWKVQQMDTNIVSLLEGTRKTNTFRKTFDAVEPQRPEYQAIKKYMNAYRKKYADVEWETLPDSKKDSAGFLAGVKNQLIRTGDYDTTSDDNDSLRMVKALKKFQKRYFLEQDGKIGRNTTLALMMTPADWVKQMAVNLERWRWEPAKFEKRHMIVNLPAFKMTVWEEDTIVMESKIVCGAVNKQTPELDSKMYQIVLYPYWNVPYSIAWKEILPHLKRDTGYLRRERYEVLDLHNELVDPKTLNWKRYSKNYLPFKFRQMTGDDNALGIMKFEFHNKWSVYMHDTNAKKYFRFETRAFSHGCMRLEKYMDLAHFLIRDDSVKLPRDTFDLWTTTGDQRKIDLRKALPIHVRYFTCETDTDGNVFLHTDIYLRDQHMLNVLYNIRPEEDETPLPATTKKEKALLYMCDEKRRFA